jgi:tripartite-type tricarboxylate transporter receptor subunit TctC
MEDSMEITRRAALGSLAALLPLASAHAEAPFPSRPLTFIIPFPAGGPSDIFGRHLAQGMSANLGQPVVVENKSGAAGVTGMDTVAKAGSDPHFMGMMSASAGAIMPLLMPKMPYDPTRDLVPIVLVVRVQEVLAVNARLGVDDFKGFVAKLKAEPGKYSYGSAGTGGISHLAGELFKGDTGTDILHVPYRGAAPAINDLLADTVQMTILDVPVMLPHIRSGALKALAVTSDQRSSLLPDVPSTRELGYPHINSDNWYGLFSPGQVSRESRQRIHDAAAAALQSKALIDAYAAIGGVVGGGTASEFATFLRKESEKWGAVIKRANIVLE